MHSEWIIQRINFIVTVDKKFEIVPEELYLILSILEGLFK